MSAHEFHDEDYVRLLGLLSAMIEAQAGRAIGAGLEWHNDRQTLAKKFAYHLSTIQTIRDGSIIQIGNLAAPFVDHGSITVLARAAVENFIVFVHIFGDPDPESNRFKHMVWQYCGLKDRQKRVAITAAGQRTLALELPQIEALKQEIVDHPLFKMFSKGKQKAIVKGDWAGGQQWSELATDIGLSSRYFRNIYSYLCDYSHSSYAAALQVGQAKTFDVQATMSSSMMRIMNFMMARFIAVYAELFSTAQALLASSETLAIVKKWNFGAERFDEIYRTHDQSQSKPPDL